MDRWVRPGVLFIVFAVVGFGLLIGAVNAADLQGLDLGDTTDDEETVPKPTEENVSFDIGCDDSGRHSLVEVRYEGGAGPIGENDTVETVYLKSGSPERGLTDSGRRKWVLPIDPGERNTITVVTDDQDVHVVAETTDGERRVLASETRPCSSFDP